MKGELKAIQYRPQVTHFYTGDSFLVESRRSRNQKDQDLEFNYSTSYTKLLQGRHHYVISITIILVSISTSLYVHVMQM